MIAFRTYNLISCVLFLKMSEDNSFMWIYDFHIFTNIWHKYTNIYTQIYDFHIFLTIHNSFSWFLFKYLRTSNIKIIFIIIIIIIKTITTFSNVIDYHQPDLSTNRTVYMYASCSWLVSVIGHLILHACVSGQNASCARAGVVHFAELTVVSQIFHCFG